jgi:putative peptidoglycan lipid II flippase
VVVLSAPVYWLLYRTLGLMGLAVASDVAILAQTACLAVLLHRRRLVRFGDLELGELGRAAVAAGVSFVSAYGLVRALPPVTSHGGDAAMIAAGTMAWVLAALVVLTVTGSALPRQILRRR